MEQIKSRSRSAAKAKRKAHIIGELKATVVVVGSFLMLMFGYLMSCPAAELPDYIGPDEIPAYTDNEYTEVFKNMTAEDWDYLGKCVQCEAGLSNLECAEGTVCVILNRVLSPNFPNTVTAVVNQGHQFSTKKKFSKAVPNTLTLTAIENVQQHGAKVIKDRLAEQGWDFLPTDYVFFSVGKATKYAKDFIYTGTSGSGQHHWLGRAK